MAPEVVLEICDEIIRRKLIKLTVQLRIHKNLTKLFEKLLLLVCSLRFG